MTIKQKIWSIPVITMLIFSFGMAVVYKISSDTVDLIQSAGKINYPYMSDIQLLAGRLSVIQGNFLDTLDTQGKSGIVNARRNAIYFRTITHDIAAIAGKTAISEELLTQFNDYFVAAESAASIIIGIKKGDTTIEMRSMTDALNLLRSTLQREQANATQAFEQSLDDSKNNLDEMLWIGMFSTFIVLLALAYISYRLITSIMASLEYLRTGVEKIAQGDFTVRIPKQGQDELALVIDSFNSMGDELLLSNNKRTQYARQLETLNTELENRVLARTAELAVALEESQKANAEVAYMASHDNLTGLLSRRRFQEEFERWGKYALRHERPVALMFIDLDNFKAVNDTYGHLGGDAYLQSVADLLKNTLRSTDYVGRWGGDEFAALLPEATSDAACQVAAKLTRIFATTPITVAGKTLFASASIGIAVMPDHTRDITELTAYADAAMYQAKDAGRGCFSLYSASEQEIQHLGEQARWASRIRRALETDQFVLFYQPLLNLVSGQVTEYEALLRMQDQSGEYISPGLFLASAERFDLSIAIDRMVIKKTVHNIAALKSHSMKLRLSLNLSTQFLDDSGMVEYIRDIIKVYGVEPGYLSIEISETVVLQNIDRVCALSAEIAKLGCRLILDDIGVGFSSFHYLAPLSIRLIKIRGDLINNLHIENNRDYVVSLCKTCHDLGIEVVAKFVEDLSLLDTLRSVGVDYAQGFAVGRPLESMHMLDQA